MPELGTTPCSCLDDSAPAPGEVVSALGAYRLGAGERVRARRQVEASGQHRVTARVAANDVPRVCLKLAVSADDVAGFQGSNRPCEGDYVLRRFTGVGDRGVGDASGRLEPLNCSVEYSASAGAAAGTADRNALKWPRL